MSDLEFENYLALLSRLLRLDGKQRESIAGELRAHLEDRLDELLAQGVARNEAVRQALEEFGDAASLAGQLGAIGRKRKRRWLMRVTTFSVAATLLIAAGIVTFWPGRNAGPGAAAVIAQNPPAAKPGAFLPAVGTPADEQNKVAAALNRRIDLSCIETPLKDVVSFLKDKTGVQFQLNLKALSDAGVQADAPLTAEFTQLRLSTCLDLLFNNLDLAYLDREDYVLVTSRQDAEGQFEIRVYDCRDLLDWPLIGVPPPGARAPGGEGAAAGGGIAGGVPGGGGFGGAAFGSGVPMPGGFAGGMGMVTDHDQRAVRLMTIITTNVEPQSWQVSERSPTGAAGSPVAGAVSEYNGLIVVTQTAQTHKKIERVLDMLREAAGINQPKGDKPKVVR